MSHLRLFATPEGESRIEPREVRFAPTALEGGNTTMGMSAPVPVGQLTHFHLPEGWIQNWHRAPRRQFVILHEGEMRIETSDGRNCTIRPGDSLLVEDISGKGHRTTVPAGECRGIVVTTPD